MKILEYLQEIKKERVLIKQNSFEMYSKMSNVILRKSVNFAISNLNMYIYI